jgi:hypothetical protein
METITTMPPGGTGQVEPPFEIRERTFQFAVRVVKLVKRFPRALGAIEIGRQLLRAATSVGANDDDVDALLQESDELVRILSTIVTKAR